MTPSDLMLYSESTGPKKGLSITSMVLAIISIIAYIMLIVFKYIPAFSSSNPLIFLYLFYGFNGLSLLGIIFGFVSFEIFTGMVGFFLNFLAFAALGVFTIIFSILLFSVS